MSYTDVVSQMQTIQTRLAQLGVLQSTAASTTSSASASAASFATALDSAAAPAAVSTSSTASTDGTLVSPNGVTGDDVVQAALQYKGVPYVLGGESASGIDCSGLVQAALAKVGVSAPRLVHEQETVGQKVDSLKDAKPGDLIVLNGGDHIAIYLGDDTVIHAPYPGRSVSVQKAWFTDKDVVSIRRVVPATDDTASGTSPTATTGSGVLGSADGTLAGIASSGTASSTGTTSASVAAAIAALTGTASTAAATGTTSSSGTAASTGLSADTIAKATSMLTTYGADVGLYSADADSSDSSGGTSLSSLLASFGLTGTSSTSSSTGSTAAQQILAARTALLGASS